LATNGLAGASDRWFAGDVWVLDLAGLGPAKRRKPILTGTSKMPKKYKMPSPEPANSSSRSLVRPHRRRYHWSDLTGEPEIRHPGEPRPCLTTSPGLTSTKAPPYPPAPREHDQTLPANRRSDALASPDLASQQASAPDMLHRLHEHRPAKSKTQTSPANQRSDAPASPFVADHYNSSSRALVLELAKRRRKGCRYSLFKTSEGILVTLQLKTTSFWVFHLF
jgi:hypothetical protein